MSSIDIAKKYEPKINKAIIDIFKAIRSEFVQKKFADILDSEGLNYAVKYLDNLVSQDLIDFYLVNILNQAINDGGNYFWKEIPEESKEKSYFAYSLLAGLTVRQVTSYQKILAQTIRQNTLDALTQKLYANYMPNISYAKLAKDLRNTIGLTAKQELAVRNYEENLRRLNRDALRRALRDKRFDSSVLRAIETGKKLTEDQIAKLVNKYRERFIKHRANTLARTEAYRAVSLGQYTAGIQALDQGAVNGEKVRRFWKDMNDGRVRDAHRAVPGMNPDGVPLDGLFQTPLGQMRFPRDPLGLPENVYNCRCWVVIRAVK